MGILQRWWDWLWNKEHRPGEYRIPGSRRWVSREYLEKFLRERPLLIEPFTEDDIEYLENIGAAEFQVSSHGAVVESVFLPPDAQSATLTVVLSEHIDNSEFRVHISDGQIRLYTVEVTKTR